jgi:type IX secretion system PorP/SprF family membrane protein
VDGSKIRLHDPGDPALDDQLRGELVPDAEFGFYLYHPHYWFGVSVPQLMRNEIRFFDEQTQSLSRLEEHYYATGGYRFLLGEDWKVEPSFMVKYVDPVPVKLDLNATVRYRDQVWLGAGYRTNDAWCAMIGCWIKGAFQFGYSYDMITSNLRNYSSGTHEVTLALTFGRPLKPAADGASAMP